MKSYQPGDNPQRYMDMRGLSELSEVEIGIYDLLSDSPMTIKQLSHGTLKGRSCIRSAIRRMESKGLATQIDIMLDIVRFDDTRKVPTQAWVRSNNSMDI